MRDYRIRSTPPPVGADPCVRPTTVGRTESAKEVEAKDGNGKEEANAKSAEICRSDIGRTHGSAPTGGSCTQSTTIGSCTQSTTGGSCTFMRYLTTHPSPLTSKKLMFNKKNSIMSTETKKNTWKLIIQLIVSIATAIATTLGVTSCMGANVYF